MARRSCRLQGPIFTFTSWETVQLSILLWNAILIPFRLSFVEGFGALILRIIDLTGDACLLLDLIFRRLISLETSKPRIAAIVMPENTFSSRLSEPAAIDKSKRERSRSESKNVRKFKAGFHLICDVLSAVPFDLVIWLITKDESVALKLRLLKLLRANKSLSQFDTIKTQMERRRIIVNAGFIRMLYLWTVFTIMAHWLSCGFFVVGYAEVSKNQPSWLEADGLVFYNETTNQPQNFPGVTYTHQYARSIYWSIITMVTVGLGDIVPASSSANETLFTLFTMYTGMILTCCVIGNLTNMVANLDHDEDEFHSKMDNLTKYMSYRHLSDDLRDRIRAYYTYMWTSLKGINENQFLSELPPTLRLQVAGLQSKDLVKQVPFLRKVREPIINAICVGLEQVITSPGDNIVRAGQAMQGCFWLRRGDAEVLGPDNSSVLQNMSGKSMSFFGEGSLFFPNNFESTIRAKSYCELFFLKKESFVEILSETMTHEEYLELKEAAAKAAKRNAKVKKFFGLDTSAPKRRGWREIFEPRSRFREIWNLINMIGGSYFTIVIPYHIATKTLLNAHHVDFGQYILSWFFDFLFVLDVCFRALYFGFVREGVIIRDRTYIFRNYRKTESWITDLVIAIPWDLAAAAFGPSVLPIARVPKLLRVGYFLRQYKVLWDYLGMRRITLTNSLHRIIKIFWGVLLIVHFVGCGWMFMSVLTRYYAVLENPDAIEQNKQRGDCISTDRDWVCEDNMSWENIDHDESFQIIYLRAIYFVLVDMTTVGYGDVVPYNTKETIYVAIITLFGGLGYPAVVGAMAALISGLNTARADFKRKLSVLTSYMAMKKFPRDLRMRINRYYDYLWSRQRGVDEQLILNDLPRPLRMEVQEYINGAIMRNIAFLQGVDAELLRHLFSVLKPSVFLPNDFIIIADELGQDMYLLERGATRVTSKDGNMTYAVLSPGDYFGEGSLLAAEKRTANVVAIGYCDCFVLNREDFDRVTKQFPEQREKVIQKLKKTMEEKRKTNGKIFENIQNHPKISAITSHDYSMRATIPDTSWRHPDSTKRRCWDVLIGFITFYNFIMIPFRITVGAPFLSYGIDFFLDILLMSDVFLRYRSFGYIEEGQVFTDVDDIKANYRKSRVFWKDLITCLPFDIIFFIAIFGLELSQNPIILLVMACTRAPKILLVLRVPILLSNLDSLFESSRVKDFDVAFRLAKLVVAVVSISHWTACGFYALANYGREGGVLTPEECQSLGLTPEIDLRPSGGCPADHFFDTPGATVEDRSCGMTPIAECLWHGTWVEHQIETGLLPLSAGTTIHRYLRALNWALPTLVVVVIGDTIPVTTSGTIYVTIGILLGVTINAAIIGSIANLVANLEGSLAQFREKMDKFEQFLYFYRIPLDLQQRTRNYLEYLWESEKGVAHTKIVDDMPATLKEEVSNFLKLEFVAKTPFFAFCDKALQKGIASKLNQQVYSPMDFIVYEGDMGNDMYFIETGHVQLVAFRSSWREAATRGSFDAGSCDSIPNPAERRISFARAKSTTGRDSHSGTYKHAQHFARRTSSTRASMTINFMKSDEDVIVLATLESGSFFGETAVFFNERRSCSVRAIEFTEVYALSKEDLDEVLLRFPHESEAMFKVVQELRESNVVRNTNLKQNVESMLEESSKLGRIIQRSQSFLAGGSVVFSMLPKNFLKSKDEEKNRKIMEKLVRANTSKAKVVPTDDNDSQRGSSGSSGRGAGRASSVRKMSSQSKLSRVHRLESQGSSFRGDVQVPPPRDNSRRASLFRVGGTNIGDGSRGRKGSVAASIIKNSGEATSNVVRRLKKHRLIFRPSSRVYRTWNILSLLFTIYMALIIPLRLVFFVDGKYPLENNVIPNAIWAWFFFDYCIDAFFIVDIVLRLRHFAINRFGKVITDRSIISQNYRKTWFWYDVVASMPLDIVAWILLPLHQEKMLLLSSVRLIRFVRILKLPYYIRFSDQYLSEIFPRLNSAVIQNFKIFALIIWLNIWYSCTWFALHRFVEASDFKTWAIVDGMAEYMPEEGKHNVFNEGLTPWFCFLRSLYFTITTMSSVGYGDIRPYSMIENVHELLVVVTGACTFAALIGSVAVTYLHIDSRGEISFKSKLRKLIQYMEFRELPNDLQKQIIQHFSNRWERFEGLELCDVMHELPLPLQLEMSMCIHKEIIAKVRGLRKCHVHIQRHIARRLKVEITSAGDYVYRDGEIGSEIYFILSGEVEITSTAEKHKKRIVKPGRYFGEDTVYSVSGERKESAKCLKDCELYFILKDDFEDIIFEFAEHKNIGLFAEILKPGKRTMKQSRELEKQVLEIAGTVQDSPLAKFASRHIDNVLGQVDTSQIRKQIYGKLDAVGEFDSSETNGSQTNRSEAKGGEHEKADGGDLARTPRSRTPRSPRVPTSLSMKRTNTKRRTSFDLHTMASVQASGLKELEDAVKKSKEGEEKKIDYEALQFKSKKAQPFQRRKTVRNSITFEDVSDFLNSSRTVNKSSSSSRETFLQGLQEVQPKARENRITELL